LDDKAVVEAVRKKATEIKTLGLPFLAQDFEALVQCQSDFDGEMELLKLQSLGPPLNPAIPTDDEIKLRSEDDVSRRLTEKLGRAFPSMEATAFENRRRTYIRAHLTRENALEDLKANQPILWERSIKCLDSEENLLVALGSTAEIPSTQLQASITRIEKALKADLPNLAHSMVTTIALGTVSDWLMRCPLDFPDVQEK
jgi:hypothetical protein